MEFQESKNEFIISLKIVTIISIFTYTFYGDLIPNSKYGYDLLFLYYGYISSVNSNLITNNFLKSIKSFYPKFIFFVLIVSLVICFFSYYPIFSLRTGISSLFGFSNFYLLSKFNPDFQKLIRLNPFGHTWAISLCFQYFLLIPIINYLKYKFNNKDFILVIITFSSFSFIFYIYSSFNYPATSEFIIIGRLWEFITGFIIHLTSNKNNIFKNISITNKNLFFILSLSYLIFFGTSLLFLNPILIIFITSLFLYSKNNNDNKNIILRFKIIHKLNNHFNSLLIWHYPIAALSFWTIGLNIWSIPIQLLLIYFLASYEEKVLDKILAFISNLNPGYNFISTTSLFFVIILIINQSSRNLFLGSLPEDLGRPYTFKNEYLETTYYPKDCGAKIDKKLDIKKCTLGDLENSKRRIVAIGNSNLFSFIQAFDIFIENNYAVTIIPAPGVKTSPSIHLENDTDKYGEYYWGEIVPELVNGMGENDILFLVSEMVDQINTDYRPAKWQHNYSRFRKSNSYTHEQNVLMFKNDLIDLVNKGSNKGIKVAVMRPIPNPTDCYGFKKQWFNKFNNNKSCEFKPKSQIRKDGNLINKALDQIEVQSPKNFKAIDLFNLFCPDDVCSYYDSKNNLLYVDGQHPSNKAARLSQRILFEKLNNF